MNLWKVQKREKLVAFLQRQVGGSGKKIRKALEANGCKINGQIERFGSSWVTGGDIVEFFQNEKPTGSFDTLFENSSFLIVNKPPGWVCNEEQCRKTFGPSVFLVHRLDKDTTGILLLAKKRVISDRLSELFAKREVEKEYLALVDGVPLKGEGIEKTFLAKKGSFEGQTIWGSAPFGDLAITRWKRVTAGEKESLIRCYPETGRTHQIRVHMAEMGHPILVDRQYARRFRSPLLAARPLLHAEKISFCFEGERVEAIAPLPSDLSLAIRQMGHLGQFSGKGQENDPWDQRGDHK